METTVVLIELKVCQRAQKYNLKQHYVEQYNSGCLPGILL